ncbi:MAG: hypothetical protein ACQETB_05655 [Halobacteriota archaeon]
MRVAYVPDPDAKTVREESVDAERIDELWEGLVSGRYPQFGQGESDPAVGYDRIGRLTDTPRWSVKTLIAAGARSREDDPVPTPTERRSDTADEQVPSTVGDRRRLRKRVAELSRRQDRLEAREATLRTAIADAARSGYRSTAQKQELDSVLKRLTEVETSKIAAQQRQEALEKRAQCRRETQLAGMRKHDRLSNRERDVRRRVATKWYPAFRAAVQAVSDEAVPGNHPSGYVGDRFTAQCAALKISAFESPILLETDRFDDPTEAATTMDVSIVRPIDATRGP